MNSGDPQPAREAAPVPPPLPMTAALALGPYDLDAMRCLARLLGAMLRPGDVLCLAGDIGAGKTAFARLVIRAMSEDDAVETPSPTFALRQIYDTPRGPVSHYDWHRLRSPGELDEIGFDEGMAAEASIVEWPERAPGRLPPDRLEIRFEETRHPEQRRLALSAHGAWVRRLGRISAIEPFLRREGWDDALIAPFPGDASARVYYRLKRAGGSALLMDWPCQPDGPPIRDGKPYSRIAHLAEDAGPFVAVAGALRRAGLRAPEIYAADVENGVLLIEDFGDAVFQSLSAAGADMSPLCRLAADALIRLRRFPPAALGLSLPRYDREALAIETELLLDWGLPFLGAPQDDETRRRFRALWNEQFDWLLAQTADSFVLRDFHSPNLILRPDGLGLDRLGVIDFQDALAGHPAYDLVSLLQDARIDLPPGLEREVLSRYLAETSEGETFLRAYALLGAQRATKILGIFARLAKRDRKPAYLRHMPRVGAYLRRNLERPELAALRAWHLDAMPGFAAAPDVSSGAPRPEAEP